MRCFRGAPPTVRHATTRVRIKPVRGHESAPYIETVTVAVSSTRLAPWTGCVVACDNGVAVVQTSEGEVRATYSGRMLGRLARDRGCAARAGDWVVLRLWPDNKVTIEDVCSTGHDAEIIELRPR